MKRLLTALLLITCFASYGQAVDTTAPKMIDNSSSLKYNFQYIKKGLIIPRYGAFGNDTASKIPGSIKLIGNTLYYSGTDGFFHPVLSSASDFYTTNGTLSSNRAVAGNQKDFFLTDAKQIYFKVNNPSQAQQGGLNMYPDFGIELSYSNVSNDAGLSVPSEGEMVQLFANGNMLEVSKDSITVNGKNIVRSINGSGANVAGDVSINLSNYLTGTFNEGQIPFATGGSGIHTFSNSQIYQTPAQNIVIGPGTTPHGQRLEVSGTMTATDYIGIHTDTAAARLHIRTDTGSSEAAIRFGKKFSTNYNDILANPTGQWTNTWPDKSGTIATTGDIPDATLKKDRSDSTGLTGYTTLYQNSLKVGNRDTISNQLISNLDSAANLRLPANQYRMLNLFSKIYSRSLVKWLTWGDSYAQKIYAQIAEYLKNILGGTSGAYNAGVFGITTNSTSGTITDQLTAFDVWPSGLATAFTSGSSRTYGIGGGAFTCEKVNVFYAKESGAGTFKVQLDGADVTGFTNISASGTKGTLGIANLIVAKGSHTATIVGLTGTVRVVSIGMEDTTISGLVSISVAQGGIPMDSSVRYSTGMANFNQFLAFVQPTVFTHEMKEASNTYAANLNSFYSTISANVANTDMIMVASPPVASNDFDQVIQNEQLRQHAKTFGYNLFDTYTPEKNYATLNAAGMAGDGVHVSQSADQYRGGLMMRDIGIVGMVGTNNPYNTYSSRISAIDTIDLKGRSGTKAPFTMISSGSGQDAKVILNRNLELYDSSGIGLLARTVGNGAQNPVIQNSSQIGSNNVRLLGNPTYMSIIYPTTGVSAHLLAASVIINGVSQSISSGGITCNLLNAGLHEITLTGNATSFAFSNGLGSGQFIYLRISQDATGGRTISGWNSSIHFQNEVPPILNAAPNSNDFFVFEQKSGSYYEVSRSVLMPRLTTTQRDAVLTLGQLQGTLTLTSGGTGYTTGTYTLVPIVSAFGTLGLATVTVNGSGVVSSVVVTSSGSGYRAGQTVSISAGAVGGTGSGYVGTIDLLNVSGSGLQVFNTDQARINIYNAFLGAWVSAMADGLTTKTYAATTNIDFNNTRMQTVSLTGDVTFTTSNIRSGSEVVIRVISDATIRNFTFPGGWTFMTSAAPTSIAASKTGMLTLRSFGTTDANIIATWVVQP